MGKAESTPGAALTPFSIVPASLCSVIQAKADPRGEILEGKQRGRDGNLLQHREREGSSLSVPVGIEGGAN